MRHKSISFQYRLRGFAYCLFLSLQIIGISGCWATFRGNNVQRLGSIESASSASEGEAGPSFFIVASWLYAGGIDTVPYKNIPFVKLVKEELKHFPYFRDYSFNPFDKSRCRYSINLQMTVSQNLRNLHIASGIAGGTFMLIPVWHTTHYSLRATVSDSSGILGVFNNHDWVKKWFHLFLLPVALLQGDVEESVKSNMLRSLLVDIEKTIKDKSVRIP